MPRIVLVTGAAAGIGFATARAFADAGDTVVVTDRDAADAIGVAGDLGPRHLGLRLDVGDERSIAAGIAAVLARFGRLDALVNNAGIVDAAARPALDIPLADAQRLIAINLRGSFLAAREAGRAMLAQGGGSIVNIASGAALAALPGRAAYGMTKAALLGVTRALAGEWAAYGIRVNAIAPGKGGGAPAMAAGIARTAAFLASPAASYVTGATWAVGGRCHDAGPGRGACNRV